MMGNNRLVLNHATMQTVVQDWIDAQFKVSPGKVTSVVPMDGNFVVAVTTETKPETSKMGNP